jgi:hypothetical protein
VELAEALEGEKNGGVVVVGAALDDVSGQRVRHAERRGGVEWLSLSLVRPHGRFIKTICSRTSDSESGGVWGPECSDGRSDPHRRHVGQHVIPLREILVPS